MRKSIHHINIKGLKEKSHFGLLIDGGGKDFKKYHHLFMISAGKKLTLHKLEIKKDKCTYEKPHS